ncbi:MAG: SPFH domain-containing protein [Ruminococcus sp.]|jgi:regulator of protease activity HflC (stomatin/prohibitin superfamily)|nr:SPFH domain-containing protein [Ruminococcus sp.]
MENQVKSIDIVKEHEASHGNGFAALILITLMLLGGIALFFTGNVLLGILGGVLIVVSFILYGGLKILAPNEAFVFTCFGKYVGTLKTDGFYFVNPFYVGFNPENLAVKKISTKVRSHKNEKQKVNDELGNPIEIGANVFWRVTNLTKAVFNVENYRTFLSMQSDAILRSVARAHPYDAADSVGGADADEMTLRGSSQAVAEELKRMLQEKVVVAGLEITEVRITDLAYAPEIAAAMLQRQQAAAIIAARQKIVEGAVGMVEMALSQLSEHEIVTLDEERKAQMVSNLLVVLCGNKDAQPIVNSGSIY